MKSEFAAEALTISSENENYFQDQLKQYQQTAESGNQTSLVSSSSAGGKDPNETVIDTEISAIETQKRTSRCLPDILLHKVAERNTVHSIANSKSSRRRQIDEMKFQNLRTKQKAEQRLQERQLGKQKEQEEI